MLNTEDYKCQYYMLQGSIFKLNDQSLKREGNRYLINHLHTNPKQKRTVCRFASAAGRVPHCEVKTNG
jgi:hypothetical protein